MEPAEHDAVVGVGLAAVGVFEDMVDFTPGGGDPAAGDEAATVSEGDRATLTAVEDPFFGSEGVDPAGVRVDQHPQHHPRTPRVQGRGDADGLVAAFDLRPPGACGDILGPRRDDECRGGAADGGQQFAGGGHEQGGGEGVVVLLGAGAGLGGRGRVVVVGGPELHRRVRVDTG